TRGRPHPAAVGLGLGRSDPAGPRGADGHPRRRPRDRPRRRRPRRARPGQPGGPRVIDLSGKSAIVTGGSRGIGRAIVLRLATQGADVAFSYRGNEAAAKDTTSAVEALGRRALAVQGDVSDPAAAEAVVAASLAAFGKIDIL